MYIDSNNFLIEKDSVILFLDFFFFFWLNYTALKLDLN